MKVYITFGQDHVHHVNGKTLDKDCIGAVECASYAQGRKWAMDWFNAKFHNCYDEDYFNEHRDEILPYYSRGVIDVN